MKSEPGPPMTLGNAAAARVRLIVWCKDCLASVEPDRSRYGSPQVDMVARVKCARCPLLPPLQ